MTIIEHTPDMAKTGEETVVPTGVRHPVVGHDDVMYRLLPFHISIAAVHAQRDGNVQPEGFPASTGDWIADGIAMRTFLEERGLWAKYRQHLADTSFVSDCPGWCGTRHADVCADGLGIVHELPVDSVTLSSGEVVTFTIQGLQDEETVEQVKPFLFVNGGHRELGDLELSGKDAALLGAAFAQAADILARIERLLAGDVEQAPVEVQS